MPLDLSQVDFNSLDSDSTEGNDVLRSTFSEAMKVNPDEHAKKKQLSNATGVPEFAVDKSTEAKFNLDKVDFNKLNKESPKTASYLSNFDNAASAHDDVDTLQSLEKSLSRFVTYNKAPVLLPQDIKKLQEESQQDFLSGKSGKQFQLKQGGYDPITGEYYRDLNAPRKVNLIPKQLNQSDLNQLMGLKTPVEEQLKPLGLLADEIPKVTEGSDVSRLETAGNQFVRGFTSTLTSVPKTLGVESAAEAKRFAREYSGLDTVAADASFGDPIAQLTMAKIDKILDPRNLGFYKVAQSIDESVNEAFKVNPEYANELLAGQIPQGFGSSLAFIVGTAISRGEAVPGMMAGASLGYTANAQSQFEDALNSGASLDQATESSRLAGVMGISEVVPISKLLDRIDKGTGGSISRAIKESLKQGTEEATQEAMQTIWSNVIASDLVEYDPDRKVLSGVGQAAGAGFTVGALFTSIGFMVTGGRKRTGVTESAKEAEDKGQFEQRQIDQINENATKSKLRQRNKESFRQFVEQADSDNNSHVFIDGTQVSLYLQGKTKEEIDADPALKLLSDQSREAGALGSDVQIPVADFAADIAGTDHFENLRDSMTMSEDTIAPFRQEQAKKETESYIENLMNEAQQNVSEYADAQEIYTKVRDQLVDTGQVTPANASIMAQVVPAWATAQAQRQGKSVAQVYQEAGLIIEGPQTGERARLEGGQVMEQGPGVPKVTIPVPESNAIAPAQAWKDDHAKKSKKLEMTAEQAAATAPTPDTDSLTGLFTDTELLSTIDRAKAAAEHSIYVESDTFNLGGLNKALGANVRADAVLKQIADAYAAAFPGMPVYRRGAGRFAAIVPIGFNVNEALTKVNDSVESIVKQNELAEIPAPKVAGAKGVSLYSGQTTITSNATTGEIIGNAQQQIEAAMPRGDQDVNRDKTFQAWATKSAGQAEGVAARVAEANRPGRGEITAVQSPARTEALERTDAKPATVERSPISPDVIREENHNRIAKQLELTPEQSAATAPVTHRDPLTGWFTDRDRKPTMARAQQFVEDTGGYAAYVVADISNLGGLNLALGNQVADVVFRNMAQIIHEKLSGIKDADVVPFRHGGDEVSFVLTNAKAEDIRQVMNKAAAEVSGYVEAVGLKDLPHAKDLTNEKRRGSGIYVGVQSIDGIDTSLDEIIDAADARVEVNKKRPLANPSLVQIKGDQVFQQLTAGSDLFVAHNLSAENILAAEELGGLAAPSIAVVRVGVSDFSGFGEVTLLAKPSLLEDKKARTFDADIYSPRQPRATYDIDQEKYSELYQKLDKQLGRPDINTLESETGADDLLRSSAVEYYWLQQQGKAPKPKQAKVETYIKKADKLGLDRWDMSKDERFVKVVTDHYRDQVKKLEELDPTRSERYEGFWFNEDGSIQSSKLQDAISSVMRYRESGGKDYSQLKNDIAKKMRVKKTRTEYEQWVTETFNDMVSKKTLFKGFTPSGNRKYVEYNMLNVVKEMTQKLQAGENFFYGAGTIRSAYANEMKTIKQIQAKREEIISEKDMEKIKEESSKIFEDALDNLKPFYKYDADSWGYANDAGQAIIEGRRGLNETFNMTPEAQNIVDDLVEYLAALPTSYFEAKIQRPVQFSEFDTAVVPRGMRKDALQVLKDAGLKIKTYDSKTEGSRADVIAKQRQLLFQPSTDKVDGARGYYDPANSIIRLQESADLSTFLHEFAHFMYEMEVKGDTEMLQNINAWYNRNAKDVAKEANEYLGKKFSAEKQLEQPAPTVLKNEGDVDKVETGKSVTFNFLHNTESATKIFGKPSKSDPFGRDYEPSARFMTVSSAERAAKAEGNIISGKITFNNPLVIPAEGIQWKKKLSEKYGGKTGKKLSLALIADGYDGIITTEKRHISEVVDFTTFDEAKALYQPSGEPPKGKAGTITESDVTAFLDNKTTGDRNKDAAIRRAVHEQFARGFEAYLMEGKAPSIELRNAFRTFARWLGRIYQAMRGRLNVNLDDKMRAVFDRMLATEEQIQAATERAKIEPMFTDAAMAGMTEDEFADYQKRQEKVKDVQTETLRDKLIKQLTRQTEAWWKEEKQDLIDEERETLSKRQVYTARARLRDGDMKLDHATVKEMAGEMKTNKLGRTSIIIPPKLIGMTKKGAEGVHPDVAAAYFGYRSGSEMLRDLVRAPSLKDAAEANAEARMIERHGDIMNDGTIEKEADEAVQNEERGKLILHELKMISRGTKAPKVDRAIIKSVAEERIGRLSFREIHPGKYRKAEINAAQEAARMLAQGNREGAAQAKMRQVMNYYLGMAATNAKNDTVKIVDRMARYNKKKVREQIQKAEGGYLDQIDKILNRFEFRKSATLKEVESLNTWVKERTEVEGDGLVISNAVLNESYVTHWKNVPFSDLQGVNDSVKNIEHVARYANKLTRMQEELDFNQLVDRWTGSMEENVKTRFKSKRTDVAEGRNWGRWAMAQMTKIPFMTSWLDGGERAGISHQVLVQPFTEAYDAEVRLWAEAGKPVMDLIEGRSKADMKRHNKKIYIPEIDDNLYGHQVIAVALNTGNQSNLKKLLLGEGWANPDKDTEITFENPKLQAVLQNMTKSDWELVQKIWDQMETLYPKLAEVHRRTTGLMPPKIESTPVVTEHGTFRGGYYPVKYDPNRDHRAAINEDKLNAETESMFSNGASIQASVNAGATNERTGYYAPIRLSLDVVPAHFQETIHYITHHDPVREVNRLIRNKKVATTIKEKLGPEEYAQLKPWLNDIAKDGREAPTKMFWDSMLQRLRFGVTLGTMGFKASTGIIQVSGLSNTVAETGLGPMMQSMRSILGSTTTMKQAWQFAVENSKVMAHRTETMDREIKNAMKRIEGKRGLLAATQEVSMKHIALIQTYMVDLPSWHAAYIKGMKEWGDETRAYQYADWVVENVQGSGATKDMARIMRGQTETGRMFTMFMTFFSSLWNIERDLIKGAKSGRYSTTNVAAKAMFLFTIPVVFEMLMRGELGEPDDEDDRLQKVLTGVAMYPVQSIPFVRDIANAVTGEYGYNISPLQSIIEQGTRTIPQLVTDGFTDEEITKGQVKGATKFVGAAAGIPGVNQMWATGEHLYNVIVDGEDFTMRELLFGPDRE